MACHFVWLRSAAQAVKIRRAPWVMKRLREVEARPQRVTEKLVSKAGEIEDSEWWNVYANAFYVSIMKMKRLALPEQISLVWSYLGKRLKFQNFRFPEVFTGHRWRSERFFPRSSSRLAGDCSNTLIYLWLYGRKFRSNQPKTVIRLWF